MSDSINPLEIPPIDRPDWPHRDADAYPILVGVVFDDTGMHALLEGLRLANSQKKSELHVAYVIPDTNRSNSMSVVERHREALEQTPEKLRVFVARHAGKAKRMIRLHVRLGDPVETLLQLALDYDAQMLVVGTHGRKGLSKLAFGSVAQKIVEAGKCPVLVAMPRDFSGQSKTMIPDPPCPDCEKVQAETNGEQLWCEFHARPHVMAHAVGGSSEWYHVGGHNPSVVP